MPEHNAPFCVGFRTYLAGEGGELRAGEPLINSTSRAAGNSQVSE